MLEVLLHHLELAPHLSSSLDLSHNRVDDVVFLVCLKGDLLGFWVFLERRVEDLLLDRVVHS